MRLGGKRWKVALAALLLSTGPVCRAQGMSCDDVTAISRMADSRSNEALEKWNKAAGASYIVRLVYSFRSFELNPTKRTAASRLLSMIPPSKEVEPLWYALDGFLCKEEQVKQIKTLSQLHARMPRDIARAVLLVPEKLPDYVSYAYDSVQDPHSDYAVQMQLVCRARHARFMSAVEHLAPDDKQWFVKKIFDPNECRAIAVPEAE